MMDLRIAKLRLNSNLVNEILGMKDPLDNAIQCFITYDFFNHPTANTPLTHGYEPDIDSIISFRNKVDAFYLKHLQTEHITAELYMVIG